MLPRISTRCLNICDAEISHATEILWNCLKCRNPADIPYISEIPTAWNFGQSLVIPDISLHWTLAKIPSSGYFADIGNISRISTFETIPAACEISVSHIFRCLVEMQGGIGLLGAYLLLIILYHLCW